MEAKHQKIKEIVERQLSFSAHEMERAMRVYGFGLHPAKYESDIGLDVLKNAALLHDVARVKGSNTKLVALTIQFSGLRWLLNFLKHLVILKKK